ncbi:MAG: hypothetical protein AB7N91_23465 [Candidatus Tectimicrobiota bacterium]
MARRRGYVVLCTGLLQILLGCATGPRLEDRAVPYVARLLPVPESDQSRPASPAPAQPDATPEKRRKARQEATAPTRQPVWPELDFPATGAVPSPLVPRQPYDYERALDEQEQLYRLRRHVQELEQEQRERRWEEERIRDRERSFAR